MVCIMIDGVPVPSARASISVLDHGFLYGDSVYEVVKTRGGRLFAAKPHLHRLRYSAQRMEIPVNADDRTLLDELRGMVALVGSEEVYLRIVITRGIGSMGLHPEGCEHPKRILYGLAHQPLDSALYREGVRIISLAPERDERGNIKTGVNLSNIRAAKEARRRGAHEALRLSESGCVAECATSNVFWVKNGKLFTPAIGAGILKGVTRQLVLHLANQLNLRVLQGLYPLRDLLSAEEVFITSTTRDILPISNIDDFAFPVGPVTGLLMDHFGDIGEMEIELY